ncbi:protein RFT1 homolog isoform X1 [Pogonomyrmex barbatus]|uniref:Protein RFT1 homolog n=2 Tax=Pogonomyrmex barbatus TaxID=144034 RepID=A0A6I9WNR8_9HYME|nr:protein RFT1 homolog isoform X1 [Pogonomyrmex barbatus]XP_011644755.1 protein RFT1 homolog isoform X1 [Pogonomyrmex barbatus]XP_011644756.1 protein RFT1 homolog isoform X1 [Pogonomyrmex barbatus]XP_011644757.1 protein RFT1 homolog isoform X1 [Pogonomyrmex barbatus]
MPPNILKSSLEYASFSIIFQIFCRCVTFVLNAFVVRHVGQAILGVINVRLLLLESMILFLSREPFVKACLTNTAEHNWAQVVNLLWLTVPICAVMSFLFGYIWLFMLSTEEALPSYYTFAVWAVGLSCIIELSSLVIQLAANAFLFVKLKIILDTIMIVIRTMTFVPLIVYHPENALFAFGVAQLVAAIFYTISHYAYFHYYIEKLNKCSQKRRMSLKDSNDEYIIKEFPFHAVKDFLPGQLENNDSYLDRKLTILTWSFFRQGILKQILTEGERLIMTIMPVLTFTEQGVYEIVNNMGSLAARFIFRPIEDSGYFYFTQMVKRDKAISDQNPVKIQESVNVLTHLCSIVTSIGLIVLIFGQFYSSMLLELYGGSKLTSPLPVFLLRAHCLAVLLLGINGVTECYTNATADSATINKSNVIMIFESIAFLGASYLFATWFGPVGFIFGNCMNMILRIIYSMMFINRRHQDTIYRPLRGLVPKPMFSTCLLVAAFVTSLSHSYFFPDEKVRHLLIGIIMFMIVLISWTYENYELIKLATSKWYEKRDKQKKSD